MKKGRSGVVCVAEHWAEPSTATPECSGKWERTRRQTSVFLSSKCREPSIFDASVNKLLGMPNATYLSHERLCPLERRDW